MHVGAMPVQGGVVEVAVVIQPFQIVMIPVRVTTAILETVLAYVIPITNVQLLDTSVHVRTVVSPIQRHLQPPLRPLVVGMEIQMLGNNVIMVLTIVIFQMPADQTANGLFVEIMF